MASKGDDRKKRQTKRMRPAREQQQAAEKTQQAPEEDPEQPTPPAKPLVQDDQQPGASSQSAREKKRAEPITSIPQLRDNKVKSDLIEWWQAHPALYDRKTDGYHNTEKKNKLLEDKAKEMGITVDQLKRFFKSYRDSYNKIQKVVDKATQSGSTPLGPRVLSANDQWIYDNMGWVKPHLAPHKGKSVGLGPEPETEEPDQMPTEETQQDDDELQEEMLFYDNDLATPEKAPDCPRPPTHQPKGRGKKPTITQSCLRKAVASQVKAVTQGMRNQISDMVDRVTNRDLSPEHSWGRFLYSVSVSLHPTVQAEWRQKTFILANDFLARSNAMRAQPEDHQSSQRAPLQDHHSSTFVPPRTSSFRLSGGTMGSVEAADGFTCHNNMTLTSFDDPSCLRSVPLHTPPSAVVPGVGEMISLEQVPQECRQTSFGRHQLQSAARDAQENIYATSMVFPPGLATGQHQGEVKSEIESDP
ncbi:uncharacterized protein LOC143037436 [Oratosquilla oratoria]|uniref:uncharacterized protein LOC143037436 n=1 Tax=Oratosquilla oratoria TaxID=337810 RepID=UPI003F767442